MRPPPPPPRRPKQPQPAQPAPEPRRDPPPQAPPAQPAAPRTEGPPEEEASPRPKRPAPAAQEPPPPDDPEAPPEEAEAQPPRQPEPPAPPPHTPANPAHRRFRTGATPTPPDKREAAPKFRPGARAATVTQKAWVPPHLSMWGNDQYGDCVSASEAFAKACHAPSLGATDDEVVAWARDHDALDGAYLPDVMEQMAADGMVISASGDMDPWKDGPYRSVGYQDERTLQAALSEGPVKLGIMSSALPDGAGNQMGWYAVGPGPRGQEDHCVELAGFGPAGWLYDQVGVPVPPGLRADQRGYLLFTWSTLGFVTHDWLVAAAGEAWVREPTTVEHEPAPEPPAPPAPEGLTLTLPADLPAGTYTLTPAGDAAKAGSVTIPAALVGALRALLCGTKGEGEGHAAD